MDRPDDQNAPRHKITDWENAKVESIARHFPEVPAVEMKAQLRARLLELKCRPPQSIRHWKAYCATSLRHEASRFARRWQTWQRKELSSSQFEEVEERMADRQEAFFGADVPQEDRRIAFQAAWAELTPEWREAWLLLDEEDGNLTRVAIRLGKHRNTIRLWVRKIHEVLRKHGLE